MRALALGLALIPLPLWADDIPLKSDVTAVTLYPQGATVTRVVPFEMPAGEHRLVLSDLPRSTPLESVRVSVEGAAMGGVTARSDFVPPRDPEKGAALEAAEAEVERLEAALRDAEAGVRAIRLEAEAARARTAFLERLGEGEGLAALDVAALRALVGMIGDETLAALRAAFDADQRAAAAERDLTDLRESLDKARQALAALVPEDEARALLAVDVAADAAATGTLTLRYPVQDAGWIPVYDLRLDRAAGTLSIERGAFVTQSTGENWAGVAVSLSSVRPSEQNEPSELPALLRRIGDPEDLYPKAARTVAEDFAGAAMAEAPEPAPVIEAEARLDGLSVTYAYPAPVDIATGADRVRLRLGTVSTGADITARAVPLWDRTAFLMAGISNDTGEPILPTGEAMFYLDGRFVGRRWLDLVPAGGEADLSFGPIEGLRLDRIVLDRNEGDRGVIRKSNEERETVRLEVTNLTGEAWPVRLIDRVPYSEQEDLTISWQADPAPDETDLDGRRGVMAWHFDLPAGETRRVELSQRLSWPEGKVLR
jgi:uncharacterized protein (TIGR02231 family)